MATKIPFRKIYVDSRYCTSDSVSSSNFKVELPITAQMPDNTVYFISDVCIPHSWLTVETNFNDKLYITLLDTRTGVYNNYTLQLISDYYTVDTFITELQRVFRLIPGSFSVTADTNHANGAIIAVTDERYKFKIVTDDDLVNHRYWTGDRFTQDSVNSANDIINNTVSTNTLNDTLRPYKTGFLSLNWLNNIYLCSPNLGSFDTIFAGTGAGLGNNVIKKIPCTVNYGYMIVDQFSATNEFLDVSRQTLQTIEFHLRTSRGKFVPLHGAHISFSIIFNKYNPDL